MVICKNPNCERGYRKHDGIVVVELVQLLRSIRHASRVPDPIIIQRLTELAPRIYQTGPPPCAGCGQPTLALHTGQGEPPEVNFLLENIELLQMPEYGILPAAD